MGVEVAALRDGVVIGYREKIEPRLPRGLVQQFRRAAGVGVEGGTVEVAAIPPAVQLLHLGVNTAIFRWRAPDGSEVVVMYQNSYGATDFPARPDVGLSFAHTNGNVGPQSVGQTVEALRHLRHEQPDAEIVASPLDAFGAEM